MEWLQEFFSKLYHFEELIRWGGYLVLVIIIYAETGLLAGFFLPGDSLLVTAGLLAAVDNALNIWVLIPLLSAAAIVGDSTGYWIGYHFGPRLFNRTDSFFFHKDHLVRTQKFYDKYGPKTIVIARFVPIVRTFAPTVAGVGKMDYRKFLFYNVAGGILWIISMTLVGFILGRSIPNIEKKIHWVIAVVIFLSILPIIKEWFHSRKKPAA
ncbi:MAG TPA: VTT domain-containing protein [Candidatus Omnitrophota bacterium]|nr:VTT domain-containing protein [Candidatus Omnitrophota bacterium]HRY84980.1 VTT domain-containing protein [Candidatus Omnitrophota bacterium]